MFDQTFADFPRQVQAGEIRVFLLQFLDDAETLPVMLETAVGFHQAIQHGFALVTKGRMAEIVRQRNRLRQVPVQAQGAGEVARDGGDLDRVGQPGAEMIAGAVEKDLRLVFQPAEGAGMDDPVAVALILGTPFGRRLGMFASAGVAAELSIGGKRLSLNLFQFLARARHVSRQQAYATQRLKAII